MFIYTRALSLSYSVIRSVSYAFCDTYGALHLGSKEVNIDGQWYLFFFFIPLEFEIKC